MGALPKQRISKARQGRRRTHHVVQPPTLAECPRCGEMKRTHHVCLNCGTYDGIQIIEPRKSGRA